MENATDNHAPRLATCGGLLLLVWCVYLLTGSGHFDVLDEYQVFFQGESLREEGTLAVPQAEKFGVWYGVRDQEGNPHAPYGPAHPWATLPWHVVANAVTSKAEQPRPPKDLLAHAILLTSSSFFAAIAVALFYALLRRLGCADVPAIMLALGFAFTTPLWVYTGALYSEPLAIALLLGAAWALERATRGNEVRYPSVALCGVLLGLALLTRFTHALAAPVFGLALLTATGDPRRRTAAFFLLGGVSALFFVVYLGYNQVRFGDPWHLGYPDRVEGGKFLSGFTTPFWDGLRGFLVSRGKSLILFVPLLVLAGLGAPFLWFRRRPMVVAGFGSLLVYLVFFSRTTQWEGGYCWGPRYVLPAVPLALLACASLYRITIPGLRGMRIVLLAVGLLVQLPAVMTAPYEAIFRAGKGSYYDHQHDYQSSYDAVGWQWSLVGRTFKEALDDGAKPMDPSQGFDFWWDSLRRDGAPAGWIWLAVGVQLAGAVGGGLLIRRGLARGSHSSAGGLS